MSVIKIRYKESHDLLDCAALTCTVMLLKCCFSTSFCSYSVAAVVSAHLLQFFVSCFDGTQYIPRFVVKFISFFARYRFQCRFIASFCFIFNHLSIFFSFLAG